MSPRLDRDLGERPFAINAVVAMPLSQLGQHERKRNSFLSHQDAARGYDALQSLHEPRLDRFNEPATGLVQTKMWDALL